MIKYQNFRISHPSLGLQHVPPIILRNEPACKNVTLGDKNNNRGEVKETSAKKRILPENYDPLEFVAQLGKRARTAPRIATSRPRYTPVPTRSTLSATITSSGLKNSNDDIFNVDIEAIKWKFDLDHKRVEQLVDWLRKEGEQKTMGEEKNFEALLKDLYKITEPTARAASDDPDVLNLSCGDFNLDLFND